MSHLWVSTADLERLADPVGEVGYFYVRRKGRGERGYRGETPGHADRLRTATFATPREAARALVFLLKRRYGDRWADCFPERPGLPVPPRPPLAFAPDPAPDPEPLPEELPVAKPPDPAPAPPAPKPGDPAVLFATLLAARAAGDLWLEHCVAGWIAERGGARVTFDAQQGA